MDLTHCVPALTTGLPTAAAGAEVLDDFVIGGNRLGLPWDGDCGGVGPAFGCWNVHVDGRGSNWESLWACLASFKEDLDGYAGFVRRVACACFGRCVLKCSDRLLPMRAGTLATQP